MTPLQPLTPTPAPVSAGPVGERFPTRSVPFPREPPFTRSLLVLGASMRAALGDLAPTAAHAGVVVGGPIAVGLAAGQLAPSVAVPAAWLAASAVLAAAAWWTLRTADDRGAAWAYVLASPADPRLVLAGRALGLGLAAFAIVNAAVLVAAASVGQGPSFANPRAVASAWVLAFAAQAAWAVLVGGLLAFLPRAPVRESLRDVLVVLLAGGLPPLAFAAASVRPFSVPFGATWAFAAAQLAGQMAPMADAFQADVVTALAMALGETLLAAWAITVATGRWRRPGALR